MRLRKFIRPARTSDEFLAGETPERHDRRLTNTQNLSSSETSDSPEEPVYKPPKSPKPKYVKRSAYRGPVTEYDPSLPPAAFPTIDNNIPRKDQIVPESSNVSIEAQPAVSCRHARSDKITSNNSGLAHRPPTHTSRIATVDQPSVRPENVKTIYATNLQKMKQSMEMSSVDTFAREMESSDEDEPTGNKSGPARWKPTYEPSWEELSAAQKLDMLDSVYELYPEESPEKLMNRLRIEPDQREETITLLLDRQDRKTAEGASSDALQKEAMDYLLNRNGKGLSQARYHTMVQDNLYSNLGGDYSTSTRSEVAKAKNYFKWCGFDPDLIAWDSPSVDAAPAAPGVQLFKQPPLAQSVPQQSLVQQARGNQLPLTTKAKTLQHSRSAIASQKRATLNSSTTLSIQLRSGTLPQGLAIQPGQQPTAPIRAPPTTTASSPPDLFVRRRLYGSPPLKPGRFHAPSPPASERTPTTTPVSKSSSSANGPKRNPTMTAAASSSPTPNGYVPQTTTRLASLSLRDSGRFPALNPSIQNSASANTFTGGPSITPVSLTSTNMSGLTSTQAPSPRSGKPAHAQSSGAVHAPTSISRYSPADDPRRRRHAISLGSANQFIAPPSTIPRKRASTTATDSAQGEGQPLHKRVLSNGSVAKHAEKTTMASLAKTSELAGRQPARSPKNATVVSLKGTTTRQTKTLKKAGTNDEELG